MSQLSFVPIFDEQAWLGNLSERLSNRLHRAWRDLAHRRVETPPPSLDEPCAKTDVATSAPTTRRREDIDRPSHGEAMDPRHLLELREKEASYWWHVNKRRLVMALLRGCVQPGGSILEVGCGGGFLSAALVGDGWREVASDVSYDAARFARDRGATDALVFDAGGGWPFADGSFDAVLMTDVLEHLDEDETALAEAGRILRPGGAVVVTVPAHPFLFSTWDRLVGHRRRYTRTSLTRTVRRAGLCPRRLTAWNLISFAPAVVLRTKDRWFGSTPDHAEFPEVPRVVNACLKWIGHLERTVGARVDLRWGLSYAAVLSKDEESA